MHKSNHKIVNSIREMFAKPREFSIALTRFFALEDLFIILMNQGRCVANVVRPNFLLTHSREREFREEDSCYVVELASRTRRSSPSSIYV